MPALPPDPILRKSFFSFVDHYPPKNLTSDELDAEIVFWANWFERNSLLGQGPLPGLKLQHVGRICSLGGSLTSIVGLIGILSQPIGTILTLSGFGFYLIGNIVENMGKSQTSALRDALELAKMRQLSLLREIQRRQML